MNKIKKLTTMNIFKKLKSKNSIQILTVSSRNAWAESPQCTGSPKTILDSLL